MGEISWTRYGAIDTWMMLIKMLTKGEYHRIYVWYGLLQNDAWFSVKVNGRSEEWTINWKTLFSASPTVEVAQTFCTIMLLIPPGLEVN